MKLLRALQERVVFRVGDSKPEKVDIRVVAATNRVLEDEIRAGRFREDLYYRLNVVNIYLPPLRERGDDVLIIAKALLSKYAEELGSHVQGFTPQALAAIKKSPWPGNIRQLENRIKKALVLCDKSLLDAGGPRPRQGARTARSCRSRRRKRSSSASTCSRSSSATTATARRPRATSASIRAPSSATSSARRTRRHPRAASRSTSKGAGALFEQPRRAVCRKGHMSNAWRPSSLVLGFVAVAALGGCSAAPKAADAGSATALLLPPPDAAQPPPPTRAPTRLAAEPPPRSAALDAGSALFRRLRPPLPRPAIPGAHVVLLPRPRLEATPAPPTSSIAPGETPSAEFPAGTVYLASTEAGSGYVAEWDLARAAVRRRVTLDVGEVDPGLRVRRIGDALHLVAWTPKGDIRYVRLSLGLEATPARSLGQSVGGPGPVVGNPKWTLVLFDGIPANAASPDAHAYYAASFDATGRPIAQRMLSLEKPFERASDVAVAIDGNAFVALDTYADGPVEVLRLTSSLYADKVERMYPPTNRAGHAVPFEGFFHWQDEFYAVWRGGASMQSFSASGGQGDYVSSCDFPYSVFDADVDLWLSNEHVSLHEDNVDDWIEWFDSVPPVEPCGALHYER